MSNSPLGSPVPQRYLAIPAVKPRLTYILLGANILIYLIGEWFLPNLVAWGARNNPLIAAGEWWRLFTPIFLHVNLLHIGVNSYSLFAFGPQVEALHGYRRYLVIYFLSGISGVVFGFAFSPAPSVGASTAIFGLIGAMLVYFYRHRQLFGERGQRILIEIAVVAGLNLLIGLSPGIDNWGHIGGLLGGLVLAWLIGPIYAVKLDPTAQPTLGGGNATVVDTNPLAGQRWVAILAIILALTAAVMVIATGQS